MYRDDDEETIRFQAVTPPPAALSGPARASLSGRELHVAELLRREGRPADEERGGMSLSKLVAIASGGVVLAGSVAFGASQWLSSPDERPLADVRFDTRPAARNSSGTGNLGGVAMPGQKPGTTSATTSTTTSTSTPEEQAAQQEATQQRAVPVQDTQAPVTQTTETQTQAPSTSASPTTTRPTTDKGTPPSSSNPTTTPPSSSSTTTPPPSSTNPPSSSTTPTSSTTPSEDSGGIQIGVGLGGFDFFAEL
ncbi:hypothetical protein [Umezawaea sp. Da 62-37]|uniref:hypothetical protein n=1 Tax=Umezawaea sp. Da 62-37 TaxID=3075927 RepID=UPI0028F738D4|nr:hypothetical protein [Umezawaea sp. Da 62-37]WNV90802.1 hypothetical protein RM788_21735 [Umezawaea sp. Da 62-37]